ncbi:MAG: hypoxanthine phosphoribosyltransferase [Nanoarchaeota archaeon]|nr:hypoxanthine phosphoribosyltransferase [Nanoarchaeota archaeon]
MSDKKIYISANEFLIDSFKLARKIKDSGFKPSFIVAIWRGGTPVGIVVHEYLKYYGIETNHIAIKTSRYEGIGKARRNVKVHGLDYIVDCANADDKLLLVDDVFDEGYSIDAVLKELKKRMGKNLPREIKVAIIYYKPKNNKTNIKPDFYIHETNEWIIFPHEVCGLSKEEIKKKGVEIAALFD